MRTSLNYHPEIGDTVIVTDEDCISTPWKIEYIGTRCGDTYANLKNEEGNTIAVDPLDLTWNVETNHWTVTRD